MPTFPEIIREFGYLTDQQIARALEGGFLLEKGTWEPTQIRHASYTLRLGQRVDIARASNSITAETKEFTLMNLTKGGPKLELRPGDTALLYSREHLHLPDCVLGFTVARGLLFAEALCPENTYVDPSFAGPIYTTVTNVSNRIIHLEYEMPITRLFFFRLATSVGVGYKAGAALGISQQLNSVRAVPIATEDECRNAPIGALCESVRLIPLAGLHTAECIDRLHARQLRMERRVIVLAIAWPVLLMAANESDVVKQKMGAFAANVSASVVAAALCFLAPKIWTFFAGRRK